MAVAALHVRAQSSPAELESFTQEAREAAFEKAVCEADFDEAERLLGLGLRIRDPLLPSFASFKMDPEIKEAIITFLLENGASIDAVDRLGRSALHHVARLGDLRLIELILGYAPNLDARDRWGYTPLHEVVENPLLDTRAIEWLLDAGASIDQPTFKGETALALSLIGGYYPKARALFALGAFPNIQDIDGYTPFSNAIVRSTLQEHPPVYGQRYLAEFNQLSLDMLERMSPSDPVYKQATALILIASAKRRNDSAHAVNTRRHILRLLELGASLSDSDALGNTPLHIAARRNDEELLRLLLDEEGIDREAWNGAGLTPLMAAAKRGRADMVEILYRSGAEVPFGVGALIEAGNLADAIELIMRP